MKTSGSWRSWESSSGNTVRSSPTLSTTWAGWDQLEEAKRLMEDCYSGEWNSLEDWAEDFLESSGQIDQMPESMRSYFDFKSYARDVELAGDVFYHRHRRQRACLLESLILNEHFMNNNKNESGQESPWLDADEIKRRVSITEVLEKYGHLDGMKQSGKRLKGLSPFREESRPSFFADTEKNIWNDFGGRPEGVPGNVIGLVQAFEGCGFREALVILHRDFIGETSLSSSGSKTGTGASASTSKGGGGGASQRTLGQAA